MPRTAYLLLAWLAGNVILVALAAMTPGRPEANWHPSKRPAVGPGTY